MLQIKTLSRDIFSPLSLEVKRGEIVAIRGASGSGKSLFLRAIVDLDPSEGEVFFNGVERNEMRASDWRKIVGFVPAQTGWWADRVGEHFERTDELIELFEALGLEPDVLNWQVSRLSSGEMQRLGLARALMLHPKVLLLDEPTSALDKVAMRQVEILIKQQAKNNVTIIIITHDDDQAKRLANKIYLLENGSLKLQKPKKRVL